MGWGRIPRGGRVGYAGLMSIDQRRQACHDRAVARGDPGYVDPGSGLFVLTSTYLASRGRCCGSGCRHCPYPVDTPRRDGPPEPESDG